MIGDRRVLIFGAEDQRTHLRMAQILDAIGGADGANDLVEEIAVAGDEIKRYSQVRKRRVSWNRCFPIRQSRRPFGPDRILSLKLQPDLCQMMEALLPGEPAQGQTAMPRTRGEASVSLASICGI